MRLSLHIALRFLTSSKGQTFMIAIGIAVGISVQIFIGSLIQGLQISLVDATIGKASHISVLPSEKNTPINDTSEIETWLTENFTDITAISPNITKGAFIDLDDSTEQIVFRGFDMVKSNAIYKWSDSLVEGNVTLEPNQVLLGLDLAKENGIAIGDDIDIIIPGNQDKDPIPVTVVGFLDLKVAQLNKTWVIGNLSDAQSYFEFDEDGSTSIETQISEPFDADLIAEAMANENSNDAIIFDNWKVQNAQLLSGLSGQSSSSYIIQVFVVISVVLGIASVLAITVLQKSRQLGILKAMGISDRSASLVFLFQGMILGILGGILGILFGLILLWSFTQFALKPDGTPVVPIFINLKFIGLSGLIAVIASTLASVVPALKSRKLSVIEVIKNG